MPQGLGHLLSSIKLQLLQTNEFNPVFHRKKDC